MNNTENSVNQETSILEKIKNIIIKKNGWMEIQEIADIMGVDRHKQLFPQGHNSTIAQLINRFLKKQGFRTERIHFEDESYTIWVCASGIPHNNFESILKNKYKSTGYTIAEKAKTKPDPVKPTEDVEDHEDNEYLNKIIDLINKGENIFITGYAGTGKSYILKKLKNMFKIDVTSTTGLAAVNVQGQTIHSWAGVGICNKPVDRVVENILKRSSLKKQIFNLKFWLLMKFQCLMPEH